MTSKTPKRILLTGPPGIGKTTLIKKICTNLQENNIPIRGFYTEEVRNEENVRTGFDIVTLNGQHEKLARTQEYLEPDDSDKYKMGKYFVFPQNVNIALRSIFKEEGEEFMDGIIILDEIGQMELFSKKFQKIVTDMFKKKNVKVLATVPLKRATLPIVDSLVDDLKNNLIIVDLENRNHLVDELLGTLNQ